MTAPARGLTGHLHLVCALDEGGRSYLRQQSFRVPLHISKPHLDGGVLVVNVVNPTAGLLEGDRLATSIAVESGAALSLMTPSASRAHRMRSGEAVVTQELRVAAGAWLESWPEIFIPQAGTRYRQRTTIHVEEGGGLLWCESIAPGRVAAGEVCAFTELRWALEVFAGVVCVVRERVRLTPEGEAVSALRRQFPAPYYASCVVIAPRLHAGQDCWRRLHALHDGKVWIGCGAVGHGGWVVRLLAGDSVTLRRTLVEVRRELHEAVGRRAPALRRAG